MASFHDGGGGNQQEERKYVFPRPSSLLTDLCEVLLSERLLSPEIAFSQVHQGETKLGFNDFVLVYIVSMKTEKDGNLLFYVNHKQSTVPE